LTLILTLPACKDGAVSEQQISKDVEHIPEAIERQRLLETSQQVSETTDNRESSDPHSPWIAPEHWTLDNTPRSMRLATYIIPSEAGDQEVAVTRFPGQVGGVLANINRWRGQMGLLPIAEPELADNIDQFTLQTPNGSFDGYQTRIESEQGAMIAVGIFQESINQTWFVRSTLPSTGIADQLQDQIIEFARSIAQ
jgi:hypothetical protein